MNPFQVRDRVIDQKSGKQNGLLSTKSRPKLNKSNKQSEFNNPVQDFSEESSEQEADIDESDTPGEGMENINMNNLIKQIPDYNKTSRLKSG